MARAQRIAPLAASPEIVAARPAAAGGWEVVVVRHGRLAGSTIVPAGRRPDALRRRLRDTAEVVLAAPRGRRPAATAEETEKILRWLESPGVRIVDVDGEWTCPVGGAAGARAELEPQAVARHAVAGFVAAS